MNERHLTGAASEMLVAYKFTKAGYTVYYPMLTQSKEDLVVCKDGKFSKVQVKTATTVQTNTGDAKQVRLGGCGRSEYKDGDFDILAVVVDEDVLIFTWDEVKGKTSMCVIYCLMRYFLLTHLCGISHRIWCTLSTICSDAA